MAVGPFGTGFAQSNFSFDPNISPNNQGFSQAVIAVVRRSGVGGGTGGTGGGTGSVTSVGLTEDGGTGLFTITGSPVTTAGVIDLELQTQAANAVLAGPTSGAAAKPAFRALSTADLPSGLGALISIFTPTAGGTQTWTAAPGTVLLEVYCLGGGGGGGGGGKGTGVNVGGGGGGQGGGLSYLKLPITSISGGTALIQFGTSTGQGGTGATTVGGNAGNGSVGASAQFGTFLTAYGGAWGTGGANTVAGIGGVGAQGTGLGFEAAGTPGGNASNSATTALTGGNLTAATLNTNAFGPTGGGGGGGVTSVPNIGAGGAGGGLTAAGGGFIQYVAALGGTATAGPGGAGGNFGWTGGGGGGGGGNQGAGAIGGTGGNGGLYGGGGGGGGAVFGATSNAGGPGGTGGPAAVIVIEWGNGVSGISPGNPTTKVSTIATNGTSVNYMRQDAAPAIDQGMAPTWTGLHTFKAPGPQAILGTSTAYAWGTGTNYPIIQMAGVGAVFGTGTIGINLLGGGLYWNGTNYIYGQAGTGIIASLGTGSFTISCVSTSGTAAGTATPTVVFSVGGTVTSNKIQGYGPSLAALVDMTPDRVTVLATLVLAANTVCTATLARNGNVTSLWVPAVTGSGNGATTTMVLTIPMPAAFQNNGTISYNGMAVQSAGTNQAGLVNYSGTTFTLFSTISGGTFTGITNRGLPNGLLMTWPH